MSNSFDISEIDPYHEFLIPTQTVALVLSIDKINQYVAKGMLKEAWAARQIVRIMWQAFMEEPEIDTGWGSI